MSMPSSSDEVATSARRRPAFSRSSISVRCARASEPWWARTSGSPASSLSAAASRSASRRLLTKSSVERCARTSSSSRGWIDVQMVCTGALCAAGPLGCSTGWPTLAMSAIGTSTVSSRRLGSRASTTVTARGVPPVPSANSAWMAVSGACSRPAPGAAARSRRRGAAQEARDLVEVPLRRRQADALQRLVHDALEALERQRHVRAALGGHERMDLVHDHGVHRSQPIARVRGQQQEQRLGRGDEDVGRIALEPRALVGRRVAGANRHRRHVERHALRRGHVGDARERRAQVALDVHGERLERRQIQHAAPRVALGHFARTSGDRGTRGTPPASCPCRSARESAWTRRGRSPASPAAAAASAPRRRR